ncbi:hypothetical protein MNB_SUP05-5-960 [hydrothermal vent metagenome]|uniref:Lipoprotein n=1 Tax=hydrothermal vent metagenome TaxID=652676 RepID=A0A1W1CDP9_9ZZZZ
MRIITFIIALTLFSCTSVSNNVKTNNSTFYRFDGQKGKSWEISADYNAITNWLKVYINDNIIIQERTNFVDSVTVFKGIFHNKEIKVRCISASDTKGTISLALGTGGSINREVCDVFVDRERAALFTFE